MTSTVYNCDALINGTKTNFRLLKLSPHYSWTTYRPLLSVSLHVADVKQAPQYTALSYVWGDPTPTKTILLNGRPMAVRKNLWDFFQAARSRKCTGYLWIDALCIDQSSIAERNHQVAIMGDIYRNAAHTITWLGTGTTRLSKDMQKLALCHQENRPQDIPPLRACLQNIDFRYYWGRVWTLQEYILSPSVEIWCGSASLDSRVLDWVIDVRDQATGSTIFNNYLRMSHIFLRNRTAFANRDPTAPDTDNNLLTDLRDHIGRLECSDPRDRVFAIRSLLTATDLQIWWCTTPDYSKTPQQMYEEMSYRYCRESSDGDIESWRKFAAQLQYTLRVPGDDQILGRVWRNLAHFGAEHEEMDQVDEQDALAHAEVVGSPGASTPSSFSWQ